MINNRSLLIVGGLAAAAWLASNSLYVVDETERAVKLRFGEIIEENIQPGLHVKVPITQTIRKFDTRVLTLDTDASRYLTQEQKAVIVDSYVKWQVVNPTRYYEATAGDEPSPDMVHYKHTNIHVNTHKCMCLRVYLCVCVHNTGETASNAKRRYE